MCIRAGFLFPTGDHMPHMHNLPEGFSPDVFSCDRFYVILVTPCICLFPALHFLTKITRDNEISELHQFEPLP